MSTDWGMTQEMAGDRQVMEEITPRLAEISAEVLFQEVWRRPGLSKRDRSLITVAALTALYRTHQLRAHIHIALQNGVTREEISELITHLAFYAGWPCAANAVQVAKQVYDGK